MIGDENKQKDLPLIRWWFGEDTAMQEYLVVLLYKRPSDRKINNEIKPVGDRWLREEEVPRCACLRNVSVTV